MKDKDKKVNWDVFRTKFAGCETTEFERLGMLLFCAETDNRKGLFRFRNQPGIETNPVQYKGKLTGFQAKFYTTSLARNKGDLIGSLKTSRQTYPGLEVVYVYTNCEPGFNIKSPDLKPSCMVDIETAAKKLGLSIEWRLTSHLEMQLALPENEYIHDIFFGTASSAADLMDRIARHNDLLLRPIRDRIIFDGNEIIINRDQVWHKVQSALSKRGITILTGEGGSGKTALLKNIYRLVAAELPVCIFKASEFNVKHADEVFDFGARHTFDGFLRAYADEDQKVFVIDSAERLAEIDGMDMLQRMLNELIRSGWSVLFITRGVFLNDLETFVKDYLEFNVSVCRVPLLTAGELSDLAARYKIRLPENQRFRSRLTNLFYLDQYLEHYDRIDRSGSYRDFIDLLWEKKVQGTEKRNNLNVLRDRCMITVARNRADSGAFFTDCAGLDSRALSSLVTDEILGYDSGKNGYFITHDIYEEWALDKIVRRAGDNSESTAEFFDSIGESLPMRRAFRMWLTEELRNGEDVWRDVIAETFDRMQVSQARMDEIIISVMLSPSAEKFFSRFEERIAENDFALLSRILFLLRLACVNTGQGLADNPRGSGWEGAINFIHRHRDDFLPAHIEEVIPVLKIYSGTHPRGPVTGRVGQLALFILARAMDTGDFHQHISDRFVTVLFNCAWEIKDELCKLADKALAENSCRRNRVPERIWKTLLEKPYLCVPALTAFPDRILSLCRKFWLAEDDNAGDNGLIPRTAENEFGLSCFGRSDYFPASANQTPLGFLLSVIPDLTVDFIIDFVNTVMAVYKESGRDATLREVEVHFPDSVHKQLFSHGLWECYRGTGPRVMPYLLQSVHMALEKYLLKIPAEQSPHRLKDLLLKILYRSNSASLTAVVTSVVLKCPDKLFDVAKIIFSTPEFIEADCRRRVSEDRLRSLYGIGYGLDKIRDTLYTDERLATCKEAHRKSSLEYVMLSYQISPFGNLDEAGRRKAVDDIYRIIDGFKADEKVMSQMSNIIERVDSRNVRMEMVEKTEKGLYVKFVPKERSRQSVRAAEKALAEMNELTKYSWLEEWADSHAPHRSGKDSAALEKDDGFTKAVAGLKDLMADIRSGSPRILQMYGSLPYAAASRFLREYAAFLSAEDKSLCKELVLQGITSIFDESYFYQVDDGTEASFLALPALMREFPELRNDGIEIIVLSLLRIPARGCWKRMYEQSDELFPRTQLWDSDPGLAETILATYLDIQNVIYSRPDTFGDELKDYQIAPRMLSPDALDCKQIYTLNTVMNLLPPDTADGRVRALYKKIVEEMPEAFFGARGYDDDDDFSSMAYTELRGNIFGKLASFLLCLRKEEETARFLIPLGKKLTCSDATSVFIEKLISEECRMPRISQFRNIWKMLYDVVISLKCKDSRSSYGKIITNYLLAWPYWTDGIKQWDSFDSEMLCIYQKSADDLWDCENTLYAFGRVFTSIGSPFIDEGLDCIHSVVDRQVSHRLAGTTPATVFYLEKFIGTYCLHRWERVKKDRRIKKKVTAILNYLVSCGSAKAFRQRDLI